MAIRRDRLDGPVIWLTVILFAVGTGSFLFHTFATVWAAIADTGPIMIFILSYFAISMRCYRRVRLGPVAVAAGRRSS